MNDKISPPMTVVDRRSGEDTRRARARDSMFLVGRLIRSDDQQPRDVRIRNVSATGAMVEVDRPIEPAVKLTLDVRGIGTVTGSVAWYTDGRIGMAFDTPIDPKMVRKPVGIGERAPKYGKPLV